MKIKLFNLIEYSAPNLPPIPAESCHLFRA